MSQQNSLSSTIREIGFPMVIAITALILAISSGIVNYRQNTLTDIESGLRDTRDQLQLAKNDIADMKARTLQQLVEAELTIRNRDKLLDEKDELIDQLSEANIRIKELEAQVRDLDQKLEKSKQAEAKKPKPKKISKPKAKKIAKKEPAPIKPESIKKPAQQTTATAADATPKPVETAIAEQPDKPTENVAVVKEPAVQADATDATDTAKAEPTSSAESSSTTDNPASTAKPSAALAELDIYTLNISENLQRSIGKILAESDFKATFPEKRKSMKMTKETTVFYYDKSYKPVAELLVKKLSEMTRSKVIMRKGASPFSRNKIIAHIIAD